MGPAACLVTPRGDRLSPGVTRAHVPGSAREGSVRERSASARRGSEFRAWSISPWFARAQAASSSRMVNKLLPDGLNPYSTFGGTVGYTARIRTPSRSRPLRVCESILWEIWGTVLLSSLNRMGPSARSTRILALHLSPTRESISRTTGQSASSASYGAPSERPDRTSRAMGPSVTTGPMGAVMRAGPPASRTSALDGGWAGAGIAEGSLGQGRTRLNATERSLSPSRERAQVPHRAGLVPRHGVRDL